jgi:hypothetical protein
MPMLFNRFDIHIKRLITKVTIVYVARMSGKGPCRYSGGSPGGGKGDKECGDGSKSGGISQKLRRWKAPL